MHSNDLFNSRSTKKGMDATEFTDTHGTKEPISHRGGLVQNKDRSFNS